MPFPQSYAGAVENIYNGQHVQPAVPVPMPLGVNVPCRRVLLIASPANQSVVYLVSQKEQGQNAAACAAVGMPIPQIQADSNYTPLELWVNNVNVPWICGAAGGEIVYWVAEEF